MRIIAGSLRGRRLLGPEPGSLGIRPTSDRAREALFSILQKWPMGGFLDLFGGTGAVALEACSRGYEPVICVEKHPDAIGLIERNLKGTAVQLVRKDALKLGTDAFPPQSVIFADPPYESSLALWGALAPRLAPWLQTEGVLIWESDHRTNLEAPPEWSLVDQRCYGGARFHFFRRGER